MSTETSYPSQPARAPKTNVLAIAVLFVALVGGIAGGYFKYQNEVIALDVEAETQWQQIEIQLLRQSELVPNLVEVTKGYAKHEASILTSVTNARSSLKSGVREQREEAAGEIDGAIGRLLFVAEAYPNLKADRRFQDLSMELAGTQNRIAVERRRYNEVAGQLNSRLRMFPWRLVGTGIAERPYLEVSEAKLETPKVLM